MTQREIIILTALYMETHENEEDLVPDLCDEETTLNILQELQSHGLCQKGTFYWSITMDGIQRLQEQWGQV